MLYAIQKSKAGQSLKNQEIHWRQLFKTSEDSLTSFVFERLFYLPVELFWKIVCESCYKNNLPEDSGPIISKEFWPKWDSKETSNTRYVEPDLFIQFETFDLLIEAKRYDDGGQYSQQWENEIIAYSNEIKKNGKSEKLYFIALGGLNNIHLEQISEVEIIKSRWEKLLATIQKCIKNLMSSKESTNSTDCILNVLNDLIIIFGIHGFSVGEWLESLPNQYNINSSLNIFTDMAALPLTKCIESGEWLITMPNHYKINSSF